MNVRFCHEYVTKLLLNNYVLFIAVKAFRNIAMNRSDSHICRNFIIAKYMCIIRLQHTPHIIDESLLILNGPDVLACFQLPILKRRHILLTLRFAIKYQRDLASRLQQTANMILYRDQVFSSLLLYCSSLLLPQNKQLHISYVFNNCLGLFFFLQQQAFYFEKFSTLTFAVCLKRHSKSP